MSRASAAGTVTTRALAVRAVVVALMMVAIVVPLNLQPTSAAWNDDAYFTTTVTAGEWAPAGPSGPVYNGNDDTVVTDISWTLVTNNPVQACFVAEVTTTSPTPVPWRLTMDLGRAPFNGQSSGYQLAGNDSWRYQFHSNSPGPGFIQVGGTAGGGRQTIVVGQVYEVSVCNWSLPPGVQTPGAYTVTIGQGEWTPTRACLVTTVTGNGTEPFYFGWTAQLDMQPAVAHLIANGRSFDGYSYGGNNWMFTRTANPAAGPYAWTVTSSSPANIAGSQQFSFTTCAVSN